MPQVSLLPEEKGGKNGCKGKNSPTNPNMVLLRTAEANSQAGLASLAFDGKNDPDVAKFFFVYENVAMKDSKDEEKPGEILCYLQGKAFD